MPAAMQEAQRPVLKTLSDAPLWTNVNTHDLLATRFFFQLSAALHPGTYVYIAKRTSVFTMQPVCYLPGVSYKHFTSAAVSNLVSM